MMSKQATEGKETIDFGFKEVPIQDKQKLVGEVFSNVAAKYDLMNDLMSVGLHRLWKDYFVDKVAPFAGMQHLDVAGGTGDVAFRVLRRIRQAEQQAVKQGTRVEAKGSVTVCDINAAMLREGQIKATQRNLTEGLRWVEGNAEALPFPAACMDAYTIAFGIRNVTRREEALLEAARVLKPGGRFLCLEFSRLEAPLLAQLYDAYSFAVIPRLGQLVAGDRASYQYLVESIRTFPPQCEFAEMIRAAGFQNVSYENLAAGCVAIHQGFKQFW